MKSKITKEESRMYAAILRAYGLETSKNLKAVEEFVSELSDDWGGRLLGISNKTDPDFKGAVEQKENKGVFKEFVHQTLHGGYSGDNYAGYTFLRLKEHAYLKFYYGH